MSRAVRDYDRDAIIVAFHSEGRTQDEIAALYGISRERVRQILARCGVVRSSAVFADPVAVLRCVRAPGVLSWNQVATRLGTGRTTPARILDALGVLPAVERLFRWRKAHERATAKARLIAQLQRFRAAHGLPTSADLGVKTATPKHPDMPGAQALQRRFGSVRAAYRAAGFPDRKGGRPRKPE